MIHMIVRRTLPNYGTLIGIFGKEFLTVEHFCYYLHFLSYSGCIQYVTLSVRLGSFYLNKRSGRFKYFHGSLYAWNDNKINFSQETLTLGQAYNYMTERLNEKFTTLPIFQLYISTQSIHLL